MSFRHNNSSYCIVCRKTSGVIVKRGGKMVIVNNRDSKYNNRKYMSK